MSEPATTTTVPTGPDETPDDDGVGHLRGFLRDRDVECPACGYNLRNLHRPECPECQRTLRLVLDVSDRGLGAFILAMIPGIFSGMCTGCLVAIMLIEDPGPIPPGVWLLLAFGFSSGLVALGLYLGRRRFIRLPTHDRVAIAVVVWLVHIAVFFTFVNFVS
ncbi:MAG: hypothetical protein ACYTG1_11295 [Planctomycetota bacterium]|jgi:hypothetical protein